MCNYGWFYLYPDLSSGLLGWESGEESGLGGGSGSSSGMGFLGGSGNG